MIDTWLKDDKTKVNGTKEPWPVQCTYIMEFL